MALRLIALLFTLVTLSWSPAARAAPTNIAASLVADRTVAPAGATIMLAIRMQPGHGWHGYWLNPGDAGLGMTLGWTLPPGARIGEPRYPVPGTLLISGLMNHVYEHEYAVLVPLTLPEKARPGDRVPVAVAAQWLACTDAICVPEQARLETAVSIGPAAPVDARFGEWTRRLPAPLGVTARFALEAGRIRLAVPLPAAMPLDDPHLFIAEDKVAAYAAPQTFGRHGDVLVVEFGRPDIAAASPARITGVLRLNAEGDGVSLTAVPGPVPPIAAPLAARGGATPAPFGWLVLMALAGGLLLNVMPCVFPILSLKALSLARAGESEAQARAEGLAYAAGVVLACAALGALMLVLRAAGEEIGWAFQLQEPMVVAGLLLVATAITANLAGLYELAIPGFAGAGNRKGAFATGLLAAFAATPCTGPFMAAAMGAALLLPALPAMALFAALGLGLAFPFLAVAYVPALRRALPRPGRWMAAFRHWMALPMGLTALALLWLASRVGGSGFALACAALALIVLILLRRVGAMQRRAVSARGPALALLLVPLIGAGVLPRIEAPPPLAGDAGVLPARPFTQAALASARASGRPVFVWLTADWCLTCKVNERVAIERTDVRDAFARAGVVVLRGDWTRRDPAITRYLASQGAAGVPLYVWYPPGGGAPQQLPQVLTPASLTGLAGR